MDAPDASGWAPGRVNLIGEHTDYNGGFVLPAALTLGVGVELGPAESLTIDSPTADERTAPLAAAVCRSLGVSDRVLIRVEADLPAGAGLGSSAAFELALARALGELHDLRLEERDLALACHRAENEIVRCGVMDQLVSALGDPGTALFIDCTSLALSHVALPRAIEFAVLDSGVHHANAESGYQQRRAECEAAARALGVTVLRELGPSAAQPLPDFGSVPDPLGRRARHVYEENLRVAEALAGLEAGNVPALAEVMRASHASQRDLFDVSLPEIDALVERAEAAGAHAARLTGGGFGGAVVALCDRGAGTEIAARAEAPLLALVQSK